MKIELLDLNGESTVYHRVGRYAYTNKETFGTPEPVKRAANDGRLLLISAENTAAVFVLDDS